MDKKEELRRKLREKLNAKKALRTGGVLNNEKNKETNNLNLDALKNMGIDNLNLDALKNVDINNLNLDALKNMGLNNLNLDALKNMDISNLDLKNVNIKKMQDNLKKLGIKF